MRRLYLFNLIVLILAIISGAYIALSYLVKKEKGSESRYHAVADRPTRKVLFLVSYDIGHVWSRDVVSAIHARAEALPWKLFFDVVELNAAEQDLLEQYSSARLNHALEKIKNNYYDLVITLDDKALDMLMSKAPELPAEVPIVFSGYEKFSPDLLKLHPNITGIIRRFGIFQNIQMGMNFWPDTKKIIIFPDNFLKVDSELRRQIIADSRRYGVQLVFQSDTTRTRKEFIESLQNEKEPYFLIFTPWGKLHWPEYRSYEELGLELSKIMPRPYISSLKNLIGYGTIGGYMADPDQSAREAIAQIRSVLQNSSASRTPILTGKLNQVVDCSVALQNKIAPEAIPDEAELINRQTPMKEYQLHYLVVFIAFAGCCFLALFGMISYLVAYRKLARQHMQVFKHLPLRVGVIDAKENLLFFHDGERIILSQNLRKLEEIKGFDYAEISAAFARVFKERKASTIDYNHNGKNRIMRLVPLPFEMYGKDTVLWISHDNTELYAAHIKLEDTLIKLQLVMDTMPGCVMFMDIDNEFRYTMCSNRSKEFIGLTESELLGKNDLDIFPPAEAAVFWDDVHRAAESNQPLETITRFSGINGMVTGKFFRKALVDPFGKRLLFSQIIDVTELEDSKKRLEDSNKLLHVIINALPVFFFAKDVDHDYRYLLGNKNFCEFAGCSAEDLVGSSDFELFSQDEAKHFRLHDERIFNGGVPVEFVEVVEGSGSAMRTLRTTKLPFISVDGQQMLLGTTIDITNETELLKNEQLSSRILEEIILSNDYKESLSFIAARFRALIPAERFVIIEWQDVHALPIAEFEWSSQELSKSNLDMRIVSQQRLVQIRRVLESNRIIKVDNFSAKTSNTENWSDLIQDPGCSGMIVPIFINGHFYGMVAVAVKSDQYSLTRHDERKLQSVANLIALANLRKRQLQQIHQAHYEHQMILNNIKIPIWLYDAEGKLLRVNTALLEMNGTDDSEQSVSGGGECNAVLQEVLAGKPSAQTEGIIHNRTYIIHAEAVCDDTGKMMNIVQYAIDVTELNELTRNEKVLNSCMELLMSENDMEGAIHQTLGLICNYLHAENCHLMLYDFEHMTAKCIHEYSPGGVETMQSVPLSMQASWFRRMDNRQMLMIRTDDFSENDSAFEEWRLFAQEHQFKVLIGQGVFIGGKMCGNLGVLFKENNTSFSELDQKFLRAIGRLFGLLLDRKQSREDLLNALNRAQDANKAKSFFLASVSHEIRTPLNAVIGFAELLKDDHLPSETQKEFLDHIAKSGNNLLELINDVLDLSKIEADKMSFHLEDSDFAALCSSIMEIFKQKTVHKKLQFFIELEPMPNVLIDRQRLRQILFNLVGNAVKFTDAGYVKLKSRFTIENQEYGTLEFQVCDSGIGIAQEEQEDLFDAFVQSKRMRGTFAANQGTGLGLAICHRMLKNMNGQITLKSELGKGTVFTVVLHNIRYTAHGRVLPQAEETTRVTPHSRVLNVLIVDDVMINLKVLSAMLTKLNCKTWAVTTGMQALKILQDHPIDLVISDLWMPEMNGAELAEKIRAFNSDIPIFALTADVESKNTFDTTKFNDIITKPISIQKLTELLKQYQMDV